MIVFYFDVKAMQCSILVGKGDLNEKRLRTIALNNQILG